MNDANIPRPRKDGHHEDVSKMASAIFGGGPRREVLRGPEVVQGGVALYTPSPREWVEGQPEICWGGLRYPLHQANKHFLVAGVPGSGKTVSICALLRSVFSPALRPYLGGMDRAIVYDAKQELYPILRSFGCCREQISILNPFDVRGRYWDLAADYRTTSDAVQLARAVVPVPIGHSQPFFPKSASGLLAAVLKAHMMTAPDSWDIGQVLLDCMSLKRIRSRLFTAAGHPLVALAAQLLEQPETARSIMAELVSHVMDFLPVGGCWQRAKLEGAEPVSVRRFLKSSNAIVLLGANQTHSTALSCINRLFLRKLSEEALDNEDDGQWQAHNRTWLVLDEVRELGSIDGLANLVNKGRSRGVCAVLGFQDYLGLEHSFGDKVAHELTATCAHQLFLRLGGESAMWAAKCIGRAEFRETQIARSSSMSTSMQHSKSENSSWSSGFTSSKGGASGTSDSFGVAFTHGVSVSASIREADAVMPPDISNLPLFSGDGGLHGFVCKSGIHGGLPQVHRIQVPASSLLMDQGALGMLPTECRKGFVARPAGHQDLMFPDSAQS
jgi:hypothetical protein